MVEYAAHIVVLVALYATLTYSLDLLVGETGLLSFTHGAFQGIGAYSSALLAVRLGAPFSVAVGAGAVGALLVSLIVSLPSVRLHGEYFVIATFCFQMILAGLFNNWVQLTRGPLGIPGIPPPSLFGWVVRSEFAFAAVSIVMACVAATVARLLASGPFGRVLRAIREDESFAEAMGKNTFQFKVTAFGVSAMLASLAGSLYAYYVAYVDPTSFTVMTSILIVAMVVIGGPGSAWGPLIGAILLVVVPELLRFIGLPTSVAAYTRQMVYGALLVLVVMYRPQGLVGRYAFGR